MKKTVMGLFLGILVINLIGTTIAVNDTDSSVSGCQNRYWIDNNNKECGQEEFCGMYMYYGLQTFESKTLCENAANDSEKSCSIDSDCACGKHKTTRECFVGNKKYVNTTEQCPDFCTGIGGNFETKCIDNKCKKVNKNAVCQEGTTEENGKCMFTLSNGRKAEVKIMPETASQTAIDRLGELNFTIELKEVGTGNNKEAVYELTGNKQGKFLGIFKIMATEQVQVDAETGEVKKVIKPWWAFLASGI
jgi:hypothetical protein